MEYSNFIPLKGTKLKNSKTASGPVASHLKVDAIIVLKHTKDLGFSNLTREALHDGTAEQNHSESAALNNKYEKVRAFLKHHNLEIRAEHLIAHTIDIRGTVAQFNKAFGIDLNYYKHEDKTIYGHDDHIHIPEELDDIVECILGLDNHPIIDFAGNDSTSGSSTLSINPVEMAGLYNIPEKFDCSGETIGILEFGGGYKKADISAFAKDLNIKPPQLIDVSVMGVTNTPGANGSNEVVLDLEMAAAIATNSKLAIYFSKNSPSGFYAALRAAVMDKVNKPSVISISWGAAESKWTSSAIAQFEKMLTAAKSLNITVLASSGDKGSSEGMPGTNLQYPASSPQLIACGGTEITVENNKISSEVVWNNMIGSTGGGISRVFPIPEYQKHIKMPVDATDNKAGRGIPDIAANAFGIQVLINARKVPSGGTSAVAPFFAGLIAILNKKRGKPIGYLNDNLYKNGTEKSGIFNDVTQGKNGAYSAGQGWDACTGWGSIKGDQFLSILSSPS